MIFRYGCVTDTFYLLVATVLIWYDVKNIGVHFISLRQRQIKQQKKYTLRKENERYDRKIHNIHQRYIKETSKKHQRIIKERMQVRIHE